MKTNTLNQKRKAGMTLLELTVVILVLLSLISILFVGARAWKKGSDRAGCILNIRNAQQAVRGYMNTHPEVLTGPASTVIFGTDAYMREPVCPEATTKTFAASYTYDASTLTAGSIFLDCIVNAADHVPANSGDW